MKRLPLVQALKMALFLVPFAHQAQIDYGSITLYNSLTDQAILNIADGAAYDLNVVGDSLNIVAVPPVGASVESVRFSTSTNEGRTESVAPYAFNGDASGDFLHWYSLSSHMDVPITFTVEYWSQNSAAGTLLGDDVFTVTFTKPPLDTVAPSAPTGLGSTGHTDTTIALSWTASTDNVGVSGYTIAYNTSTVEVGNVTEYQLSGLDPDTLYNITVRAVDAAGNTSAPSTVLDQATDPTGASGGTVWSESGSVASYLGGVSIGTANVPAGYALAVNGDIITEGVRVELNDPWPDYVFTEGHELPSLDDIQAFIKANGHLPKMPTAAEVAAHGIDVGQMDRLLLEKVEELTLHIIAQERRIQELEQAAQE